MSWSCASLSASASEELEVLRSIYEDELRVRLVGEETECEMLLNPTLSEDAVFVRVTLRARLPTSYPEERPIVELLHPRGLSENELACLHAGVSERVSVQYGVPVLFELIDFVRHFLSEHNYAKGLCAICLHEMRRGQRGLHRADCFHVFHNQCLLRLVQHRQAELAQERKEALRDKQPFVPRPVCCPVCRTPWEASVTAHQQEEQMEQEENDEEVFTESLRLLQQRMSLLFAQQKAKGGIIDVVADRAHLVASMPVSGDEEARPSEEGISSINR